jgi:hypothetical protein
MEVQGHPQYLIYEDGTIFNKRTGKYNRGYDRNGYTRVCLGTGKDRKDYDLHRLLAIYYIPNPENKPCVDHINRNRKDNRLCNLRWVSYSDNNLNKKCDIRSRTGIKNVNYDSRRKKAIWFFNKYNNKIYVETKALALWIKFYYHINNL